MRLVLWQSFKMISLGLAIGSIGALGAGRVLQRLVEGMQPIGPAPFVVMIPLLLGAALLASYLPARRASRIDPVKALRQE